MPYQLKVSAEAQKDIEECYNYLYYKLEGIGNPRIAEKFKTDLEKTFEMISLFAESIAFCEDEDLRAQGLRKIQLSHYKYLVFYHMENKRTGIIDLVCHAKRNYKNLLN